MNPPTSNNFSLAPMGAQQFYQMAQHHALVNGSFMPPVMPGYLPLTDSADVYSSMMPMGAYNAPQLLSHAEPAYAPDMWSSYAHIPQAQSYDVMSSVPAMSGTMHSAERHYASAIPQAAPSAAPSLPMALPASTVAAATTTTTSTGAASCEAISDEPFADEHKWRKYGQKQVKRSPYPRNYYKCTIAGCPAKKHLEKFFDQAANKERCRTIYIGEHAHPAAVSPQVYVSTQQDFRSSVLAQSAKIRLMSLDPASSEDGEDMNAQQRLVVECSTQVDENEDGYYWRKYGQKSVKGSCTPRQYYRCRNANCPVKKTVEASSKGNTIVSYDGPHNHDAGVLPESPVSTSAAAANAHAAAHQHVHHAASVPISHFYPQQHQQQQYTAVVPAYSNAAPAARPAPSASAIHPVVAAAHHQQQQAARALPPLRLTIKSESDDIYSSSAVESPSSTLSTTEEEESYLSEPSPKRFKSDNEDATYDDSAVHAYSADAPPALAWHSLWDAQFNDFLVTE